MKTTPIPPLRVDPTLREAAESMLLERESLSSFAEESLRTNVARRQMQKEFVARGLAAGDEARRTGVYIDADEVHVELEDMLTAAKVCEGNR